MTEQHTIVVRVSAEVHEQLAELSRREERSVAQTLRLIIRNHLADQRTRVHDRYCTTCESTHDGTETLRGLAWTCDGCGERQEYRA